MGLVFPNQTCNVDEDTGIIRFSGYDGLMEIRFSMTFETLDHLMKAHDEERQPHRQAFENLRSRIQNTAMRAYSRTRKSFYRLGLDSNF
ncbi:DUF1488 family protein [uncultured Cohaesibacter sp.]|uniref:DUF1488 family protein n=1 Tax=uncultured Cohaesibacter sp. TaxID=1002546 RepID=UPI003747B7A5